MVLYMFLNSENVANFVPFAHFKKWGSRALETGNVLSEIVKGVQFSTLYHYLPLSTTFLLGEKGLSLFMDSMIRLGGPT